jgi:uncharacterized DUF497 family protein
MRQHPISFEWPGVIEEKIFTKHGLTRDEVEEAFFHPRHRRLKARNVRLLLSRTDAGRYIIVVYRIEDRAARIITARDMTPSERRRFQRK